MSKAASLVLLAIAAGVPFAHAGGPDAAIVKVYNIGAGVTAPELIPGPFLEPLHSQCKKKNQKVLSADVSLIVDADGRARNLSFMKPTGTELDRVALRVAQADRFRPATMDGNHVAVWAVLGFEFEVCAIQTQAGKSKLVTYDMVAPPRRTLKPAAQSTDAAIFSDNRRVAGDVSAPKPISFPIAEYSDDARKQKISGICLVQLVVDAQGMPQAPHIVRSLYPSLDQKAVEAVSRYRFKPAMKSGLQPVPTLITIEVNFRLF